MRLIDAEYALKIAIDSIYSFKDGMGDMRDVEWLLNDCPTIEAKPIVHAHWEDDGEDDWSGLSSWYCSKCNSFIETEEDTLSYGYEFCPHCGAQMDEKEGEEK